MSSGYFDIIVIGAGAAGLAAAISAAKAGVRVLILERGKNPGRKILLAGGGKANVTNVHVSPKHYVGNNPAFSASALTRFTPTMLTDALAKADIALEEREFGQIFCRKSARELLDYLLRTCREHGCELRCNSPALSIAHSGLGFDIDTGGQILCARRLILAAGGPACPQSGADDAGVRLAKSLGHRVIPFRPVLVPLVLPENWPLHGLAGISATVEITCSAPASPSFTLPMLFTHKGISGPAVLQISCYRRSKDSVTVNWLPRMTAEDILNAPGAGKKSPRALLAPFLPDRLLAALLPQDVAVRKSAELSRKNRDELAALLHRHMVTPLRSEGMRKAEATAGGVDVADVDPQTMQSHKISGLFFCGELLDITGLLGGYNLHWAWASGYAAGLAAVKR